MYIFSRVWPEFTMTIELFSINFVCCLYITTINCADKSFMQVQSNTKYTIRL